MRRLIAMVACALACGGAAEEPFAESWAALGRGALGWSMRVAPPLPVVWPGDGRLVRYAYAYRLRPGLADGEEQVGPFARAIEAPGWAVRVEVLEGALTPIGIQGVRPLRQGELAIPALAAPAAAALAAPMTPDGARVIRTYYCFWLGVNGVVAAQVGPRHAGFIAWLDCARGTLP